MSKPSYLIFLSLPMELKCKGCWCFKLHVHIQNKEKRAGEKVIGSASSGKQTAFLETLLTVIHLYVIYIFLAETGSFAHIQVKEAWKMGTLGASLAGSVAFHLLSGVGGDWYWVENKQLLPFWIVLPDSGTLLWKVIWYSVVLLVIQPYI